MFLRRRTVSKIKATIAFWACEIIVVMNLLESEINPFFTIFWIVMAAWFAGIARGEDDNEGRM